MLEEYKTKNCENIYIHYMDAYALYFTKCRGSAEFKRFLEIPIVLENDTNELVKDFSSKVMGFTCEAQCPIVFNLFLDKESHIALQQATYSQICEIFLIRTLGAGFATPDISTLFDTSNLWSDRVVIHAYTTLYPKIPEIAEQYHMLEGFPPLN